MSFVLHSPITHYGPSSFKFQQMWTFHDLIHNCVCDAWGKNQFGHGMVRLEKKLKFLKGELRDGIKKCLVGQVIVYNGLRRG